MHSLAASEPLNDRIVPRVTRESGSLENKLHNELNQLLPSRVTHLGKVGRYHFKTRGKFIRGKLALITGDAFKVDKKLSLLWALSVELLHNASLIHDDICDHDSIRRGNRNVSAKFGEEVALIFGDWLIGKSFELAGMITAETKETLLLKSLANINC